MVNTFLYSNVRLKDLTYIIYNVTEWMHATYECDNNRTRGAGVSYAFAERVYENWTL